MTHKLAIFFRIAIILFITALALSCATSSGNLFEQVAEEEGSSQSQKNDSQKNASDNNSEKNDKEQNNGKDSQSDTSEKQPDKDSEEETEEETVPSVTIQSSPSGADVYINHLYRGKTPLTMEKLDNGRYLLTLEKDGYYSENRTIQYDGESSHTYDISLKQITGYLSLDVEPEDASIYIDGSSAGSYAELPIGMHSVTVREFGYIEQSANVMIYKESVTEKKISLEKAEFEISYFNISKSAFNPINPGTLGTLGISFRVESFGSGVITIQSEDGKEVWKHEFSRFTTWQQSEVWNGRTKNGNALPDGTYIVTLKASGVDSEKEFKYSETVRIDSSIIIKYRATTSGNSGLLFCPSPDVLPPAGAQLSSLFVLHLNESANAGGYRMPLHFSLRVGAFKRTELTIQSTLFLSGNDPVPFSYGLSGKYKFLSAGPGNLFETAITAKLTKMNNTAVDSFSNYTGLSVGLPLSLAFGNTSFYITPETTVSTEYSNFLSLSNIPDKTFYSWLYGRAGLLYEKQRWGIGASGAVRSAPFSSGFKMQLPFSLGAEAYSILFGSNLFITGEITAEIASIDNFYISGGFGTGVLF